MFGSELDSLAIKDIIEKNDKTSMRSEYWMVMMYQC